MFVKDDNGGGSASEDDGSGFIRLAAWWCFALSTTFYACLVFMVFTVDLFAAKRLTFIVAGLVIYFPAIAVWLLARWFASRE